MFATTTCAQSMPSTSFLKMALAPRARGSFSCGSQTSWPAATSTSRSRRLNSRSAALKSGPARKSLIALLFCADLHQRAFRQRLTEKLYDTVFDDPVGLASFTSAGLRLSCVSIGPDGCRRAHPGIHCGIGEPVGVAILLPAHVLYLEPRDLAQHLQRALVQRHQLGGADFVLSL